jgi:uncharacterized protein
LLRAREGDLIRTRDNIVFDVKGLVHPPGKVIAFPRYIPSSAGTRGTKKNLYGKIYNLVERFEFLKQNAPQLIVEDPVFGGAMCEVPVESINKHYEPVRKLERLRRRKQLKKLESNAVEFAHELKEAAHIPWSSIGISGSVMAGLFTDKSDFDPLVCGSKNILKANSALKQLVADKKSRFRAYNRADLQILFEFRSKDTIMSFEEFEMVESRKAFQGKFSGVDYFVRFVKDWDEVKEEYGDFLYQNCGYAKIKATIIDDSEAIFTPCSYLVENVEVLLGPQIAPISRIVSFRGRFCEQAQVGEIVVAQGKLERAINQKSRQEYFRVLLGNTPSDYMAVT